MVESTINGREIREVTINGNIVEEITCNGNIVFTSIGTENNPAESANQILSVNSNANSGIYYIQPQGHPDKFQVYCDMETDGGGWMHIGTISDKSSLTAGSGLSGRTDHPWSFGHGHDENGDINKSNNNSGIWGNPYDIGTQSFTDDFCNVDAWKSIPFSQFLLKDRGENLRNILYTNKGQISDQYSTSAKTFFSSGGNGGDVWVGGGTDRNTANQTLRTSVNNYNNSDDVFGNADNILWAYGEEKTANPSNHDRSMITRGDTNDSVSRTQGIAVSRADENLDRYRDIDPNFLDEPSNTINFDYTYTLWIR